MALPFVAGQAMRRHRLLVRRLEVVTAELERSREERAAAAVTAERMRVAREVHDVVAHSVSVMVVQASAAETTIESDAAAAKRSLTAIQGIGRQALTELRGLLGVLRTADGPAAVRTPQPGIAEFDTLAAQFSAAGLTVSLDRRVDVDGLADGLDLVLYRVAQEALTNALKHGGPGTATVTIRDVDDHVELQIVNNACAGARVRPDVNGLVPGSGHGIEGMRERVTSLGGTLTTAPTTAGGFRVSVRIPRPEQPR